MAAPLKCVYQHLRQCRQHRTELTTPRCQHRPQLTTPRRPAQLSQRHPTRAFAHTPCQARTDETGAEHEGKHDDNVEPDEDHAPPDEDYAPPDEDHAPPEPRQMEAVFNNLDAGVVRRTTRGHSRPRLPIHLDTFWTTAESTPDPHPTTPHSEFAASSIPSAAHAQLSTFRSVRALTQLAAWEMPLLAALAQPFHPPCAPTTPLRFRYTTYLGEPHPAARKVTLTFHPATLPHLTPQQVAKLLKLAGPRHNPVTGTVHLSSESHATPAQNKRALGDTLAALLAAARDATDTFADIPLDTRHAKRKPRHRFPETWLLTAERKAALESAREAAQRAEALRAGAEKIVDGVAAIDAARLLRLQAGAQQQQQQQPVAVAARRAPSQNKAGRKAMGQRARA